MKTNFEHDSRLNRCNECGSELLIRHACAGSGFRYVCKCSLCDNIILDVLGTGSIDEVIKEANNRMERTLIND